MKVIYYRGKRLNQRTIDMINAGEYILGHPVRIIQGSYNKGGVSASAGTHDGGGAADIWPTHNYVNDVVRAMRLVGFAAWHRVPSQGPWGEHIHMEAIGDPDLSSGARTQIREYYAGQNGLASHRHDDGVRFNPTPNWDWYVKNIKPSKLRGVSVSNARRQFSGAITPKYSIGILRIQFWLNVRLHKEITMDGNVGPETRAAFKEWEQHIHRKNPNSVPGRDSLNQLLGGEYTLLP